VVLLHAGHKGGAKVTFNASDPDVVALLPEWLQMQLPVILTHKGAIERDTWNQVQASILNAGNFSAAAKSIEETMLQDYYATHEQYLRFVDYKLSMRKGTLQSWQKGTQKPMPFGTYDDQQGYWGYKPSAQWLTGIFLEQMRQPMEFIKRYMGSITGSFLTADHTFKVSLGGMALRVITITVTAHTFRR